MKKITLIAAAAALLLSGGVFVKVNQLNRDFLSTNIEALTDGDHDLYDYIEQGREVYQDVHHVKPKWCFYGYATIDGKTKEEWHCYEIECWVHSNCVPGAIQYR